MILGGGPNRIGQGIEFDYCCVHAAQSLKKLGFETIMVNCNPETVSTDYDTSDKLYFEPLTLEDVLSIYRAEKPVGVIAQFGGQTPLNLASELEKNGVKILGTSPEIIDLAEDRGRFKKVMDDLNIPMPESGTAANLSEAHEIANKIDTFNTSILPYEDCCTVFLPKFPAIKPKMETVLKAESKLDVEALIEEALKNTEIIKF